jgi:hypothetical protein
VGLQSSTAGIDSANRMTIGWVEEYVRDGKAVDGFDGSAGLSTQNWDIAWPALGCCGLGFSVATLIWLWVHS